MMLPLCTSVTTRFLFASAYSIARRTSRFVPAREITHRPHASVKIEKLPQRHVQRANSAAHGRSQRPFDRDAEITNRIHRFVRQPLLEFVERLLSSEHLKPGN